MVEAFAMLPDMFCNAKDCDCRPLTAVVSASKIPITLSPRSIRYGRAAVARAWLSSKETSQSPCQIRDASYFRHLNKKPRSKDRGTIAGRATFAGSKIPKGVRKSARLGSRGMELKRKTIHAVAPAGRLRTVVEHVAEMTAATAAMNFGTQHAEGAVFVLAHGVLQRLIEARPARAALEFRRRREQ